MKHILLLAFVLSSCAAQPPGVMPNVPYSTQVVPSAANIEGSGDCVVTILGGYWRREQIARVTITGTPYAPSLDASVVGAPAPQKTPTPGTATGPISASPTIVRLDAAHPRAEVVVTQRGNTSQYDLGWARRPTSTCPGVPTGWVRTHVARGVWKSTLVITWVAATITVWPPSVMYPIGTRRLVGCAAGQPRAYHERFESPLPNASDPYGYGITTNASGCIYDRGRNRGASVLFSEPGYTGRLMLTATGQTPMQGWIFHDRFPTAAAGFSAFAPWRKGKAYVVACNDVDVCLDLSSRLRTAP